MHQILLLFVRSIADTIRDYPMALQHISTKYLKTSAYLINLVSNRKHFDGLSTNLLCSDLLNWHWIVRTDGQWWDFQSDRTDGWRIERSVNDGLSHSDFGLNASTEQNDQFGLRSDWPAVRRLERSREPQTLWKRRIELSYHCFPEFLTEKHPRTACKRSALPLILREYWRLNEGLDIKV